MAKGPWKKYARHPKYCTCAFHFKKAFQQPKETWSDALRQHIEDRERKIKQKKELISKRKAAARRERNKVAMQRRKRNAERIKQQSQTERQNDFKRSEREYNRQMREEKGLLDKGYGGFMSNLKNDQEAMDRWTAEEGPEKPYYKEEEPEENPWDFAKNVKWP